MADPNDNLDPEPVDAEFELADDDAPSSTSRKHPGLGLGPVVLLFMLASLIGGGLGFAGARLFPAPPSANEDGAAAERAALTQSITGLETRLAALETEDPDEPARRLAEQIEPRLVALETVPPGTVDLSEIENRVTALENAETEMSRIVALEERAANLELAQQDNAAQAQQALNTAQGLSASPGIDPQILENLSQRLAVLEADTVSGGTDPAPVIAALTARLEDLEAALAETRAIAAAARDTASTTAETVAARPAEDGEEARQLAARALALTALRDRAASGQAFEAERAALARLWRGDADLAALARYSRAGAPTVDDLTASFPASGIRDAAGSGRHFFGLLEVRRVNPSDDETDPLAIATLAETRLADGDLAAAVLLTEQLQEAPLEAARDWLLSARARMETDARLASLRQSLAATAAEQGADPS